MASLYDWEMAKVYDRIYQGFIDYKAEYQFYKHICNRYRSRKILEMGCGTGNLSSSFSKDFDLYVGLDFSASMLAIALEKNPLGKYIQADMRCFVVKEKFDAVLITGRSTSYLMDDDDVMNTFLKVYSTLENGGVFVFDCIDAKLFMPISKKIVRSFMYPIAIRKPMKEFQLRLRNLPHDMIWSIGRHITMKS